MSREVLLDLSFLNEAERDLITNVISKDAEIRKAEQSRIRWVFLTQKIFTKCCEQILQITRSTLFGFKFKGTECLYDVSYWLMANRNPFNMIK